MKIVIIGSGPCGLGAAWRLQELGHTDFKLFDRLSYPGGLAASFVDENGFTWDIGGHVQFSHYKYFDELMDSLLPNEWLEHERESWVWIDNRFLPYPFQNNIRHLEKQDVYECITSLIDLQGKTPEKPKNFREWILATFGSGIATKFMLPYNFKVWAYDPSTMQYSWIGERVAVIDVKRIIKNVVFEQDELSWGPNNKFRFPVRGGTGMIWRRLYERLDKEKIFLNHEVKSIDTSAKIVNFTNGHKEHYDKLVSTMPLDLLIKATDLPDKSAASQLVHSSTHIIGIGLRGQTPEHLRKMCWMYFPEADCPFYRVTVFSKYSPNHVPDNTKNWSLMAEVSESPEKPVDHATVVEETIQGMLNTKLISSREDIVSIWHHYEPYGYPTPSLHRNEGLMVLPELEKHGILSRGRFGAWKYEVSNQDHTMMQGIEAINHILKGEEEITLWHPEIVNAKK